jgi:hypothetical protein
MGMDCANSAAMASNWEAHRFAAAFALLLLGLLLGICLGQARLWRRPDRGHRTIALGLFFAHGSRHICYYAISHLGAPYPSCAIEGHRNAKRYGRRDARKVVMAGRRLWAARRAKEG